MTRKPYIQKNVASLSYIPYLRRIYTEECGEFIVHPASKKEFEGDNTHNRTQLSFSRRRSCQRCGRCLSSSPTRWLCLASSHPAPSWMTSARSSSASV